VTAVFKVLLLAYLFTYEIAVDCVTSLASKSRGRLNIKVTALAEAECAAECCNGPSVEAESFAEGLTGYLAETEY